MFSSPKNIFPTWRHGGAWPYELGLAVLMLWLSAGVANVERMKPRYGPGFIVWELVDDAPLLWAIALWCCAACLWLGFLLNKACPRCSYVARLVGLGSASLGLFVFAFAFLRAFEWSVGGAVSLFLAWRTSVVTAVVWRRARRAFRAAKSTKS